jgi:hypothetical protein
MALKRVEPEPQPITGEVPHDALERVAQRVKEILARRDAALRSRRAADRLEEPPK